MNETRSARLMFSILLTFAIAWSPLTGTAAAQVSDSNSGVERPGASDPVSKPSRLNLFSHDMLGVSSTLGDQIITRSWCVPTDDSLADWQQLSSGEYSVFDVPEYNITNSPTAVAKGRILTLERDHAVIAFYTNDNGRAEPVVAFLNSPQTNYILPGSYQSGIPDGTFATIGIAVGDIDGVVNDNDERLDEIVVAYRKKNASSGFSVWIAALKADSTSQFTVVDNVQTSDSEVDSSYSFMSLAMGDFDADGKSEIALIYRTLDQNHYHMCLFKFENGKLLQKGSYSEDISFVHGLGGSPELYNQVDLTSGDFDGDGKDEVAAIYGRNEWYSTPAPSSSPQWCYLATYRIDGDFNVTRCDTAPLYDGRGYVETNRGAAVTAGLFKYDPDTGYSIDRRQLALVVTNIPRTADLTSYDNWAPEVFLFDVDTDLHLTQTDWNGLGGSTFPFVTPPVTLKPEIVAGRFVSLDNPQVTDQIAGSYSTSYAIGEYPCAFFGIATVDSDMHFHAPCGPQSFGQPCGGLSPIPVPITAACTKKGQSYYLGTPVHLSFPNVLSSVRIIQEPPKHIDYLPSDPGSDSCGWEIFNVSRRHDFYASFQQSDSETITTQSTNRTDWDIGGSEQETAKATVSGGFCGIDKVTLSSEQSEKVSYDYNSVTEKMNGKYQSITFGEKFETSTDDAIQLKAMWLDIWRYPVYGLENQKGTNSFYEVILPSTSPSIMTLPGTSASDFYQPIHENGNLLSYPMINASGFPYDLGSFEVEGQSYQEVMTMPQDLSYGALEETYYIEWGDKQWEGKLTKQQNTLSENADMKVGIKGKASFLFASASLSLDVDLSFHNTNSWSKSAHSTSTTKTDGKVTVYVPGASNEYDYQFRPILYTTTDGTLKLAHTVQPNSTSGFWQQYYHGQPDLSLNLPMKFWWEEPSNPAALGTWYMGKTRQLRSRMRGVFLYENDPEANPGNEHLLAGSPVAGDTIYVQVYVYNYSIDTATGGFTVRFSYAPYDADLGDKDPQLTNFADVRVGSLEPLERRTVTAKWEIAEDLGGDAPGTGKPYVIYVTLDPDNEVSNEIHELYVKDQSPQPTGSCPTGSGEYAAESGIFCGSNNQGYWPWDNSFMIFSPGGDEQQTRSFDSLVQAAQDLSVMGRELKIIDIFKTLYQYMTNTDVGIVKESLTIEPTPESAKFNGQVFTQVPYRLKLQIVSNRSERGFREVFFYDNDQVFSVKRVFGLNAGQNFFTCRWTPQQPGTHTLKAMIWEDDQDPLPGNNADVIEVEVLDIHLPPHR